MHTVTLVFDNESQEKINKIRNILNDNNIKSDLVLNHISIAGYNEDLSKDVINQISKYFKNIELLELNIIEVNTFNNEKNVIYLEFDKLEELKKIKQDFLDYMKKYNLDLKEYYKDDWIPHSTIAIGITNDELDKGYRLLQKEIVFPIKVVLNKVDIL